jgi:hypothetical protein
MYIDPPEVRDIVKRCFPDYNGRKIAVLPFPGRLSLKSYWDGGSRDYWAVTRLAEGPIFDVPENGTFFTPELGDVTTLPVGYVIARHSIFCGCRQSDRN